jgi:hypothetical protein
VTTTLNGFPSSWDSFVQGIFSRSKLPKFDKLWSNCTQEESRLISKSQKTNDDENQALAAHVKKRKERREVSPKKAKRPRYKKDASKFRCYNCKKLVLGMCYILCTKIFGPTYFRRFQADILPTYYRWADIFPGRHISGTT